ncbi:MAG TPA: ATP-binding cassette domain-containing protein [Acidimicrobiales bacterium]|nr:ATP-binding cassette domain-containing protein [Acidimicrobiales bacterium]
MSDDNLVIEAQGLEKNYGSTRALAGVDLAVTAGSILGVLGPNGAGKTTAVRILTTLALPDKGWARVAGYDVVKEAQAVRRRIGVTAQDATLDLALTGRQNLVMIGELSGLRRKTSKVRASELLERFELSEAADRVVKGYSGGMRRRLDLAAGLVTRPPVIFLDEPTTGLDPTSRARMWDVIRELVADGTTLLLTTQYLDEADQLADRIVVIDHGRVIAQGSAAELKAATGGARLEATIAEANPAAVRALAPLVEGRVHVSADGRRLRAAVRSQSGLASAVVRALDEAGIAVDDVEVRQPSLDDVFFALTGRDESEPNADETDQELDESNHDRADRGRAGSAARAASVPGSSGFGVAGGVGRQDTHRLALRALGNEDDEDEEVTA